MHPNRHIVLPLVVVAALATPVAAQAGSHGHGSHGHSSHGHGPVPVPVPPSGQQLKLYAWQGQSDAKWQKRTWRKTRSWCMDRVDHAPRWRTVLQKGRCGTVVQSGKLAKNVTYQVTVSGLISHWTGTWKKTCGSPIASTDPTRGSAAFNASADPQWTFANKKGTFWCNLLGPHLPTVGAGFRINNDPNGSPKGWKYPWMGQSKTYVRSNHAYTFTLKGTGKPAYFGIYDHWTTDNYGSFDIAVAPVVAPPAP